MKVVNINPTDSTKICRRVKDVCNKAKTSGNDIKTTAELLAEIQNIGLEKFLYYLDNYIC